MKALSAVFASIFITVDSCEYHLQGNPISTTLLGVLPRVFSRTNEHYMLTIIHDASGVELASGISTVLERHPQIMFSYQQVHTALVPVMENLMEHASLEQMRDQLQFLVVCGVTCVKRLFTEVQNLDHVHGQGSLLRHFSTWLIISPDDLHPLNISFDNVARIRCSKEQQWNFQMQITIKGIYTLLWMPSRREWASVVLSTFNKVSLNSILYPNTERGLNGRELVITTLEWSTFAIRKDSKGTVAYTGTGIDLTDYLKTAFNFSYVIREPGDGVWGQEIENGTFTGILGMMQRREAHLCPVPYALTDSRNKIMDVSFPLSARDYTLVYKANPDINYSWLFLVSSYSRPAYLCGASAVLGVYILLCCFGKSVENDVKNNAQTNIGYFDIIFRIPLRQDLQTSPRAMSSRILNFTLSLFCLVFAALYTSNLVAMMSVHKDTVPFSTLIELADHTSYQLVTFEGGSVHTVLRESKDPTLRKIYENSILLASINDSFEKFFALEEMRIIERWETARLPKPKECDPVIHRPKFTLNHFKSGLVVTCCGITTAGLILVVETLRHRRNVNKL